MTFPGSDCNFTKKCTTMKKCLLFITLMMVFVFSQTQEYHPLVDTNNLWSVAHQYFPGWTPYSDFTKFQGEETIQGNIYKKVWTTTDTTLTNWNSNGYVREDTNKQVYFRYWAGGPDDLRYDFGANSGDTIYLFNDPMGNFLVVDSIDTYILLSGETRKRINLSCHGPERNFLGNDTWIEGMGSLYGITQSGSCLLVGDMPQLICFTENDTLKYFNDNFDNCYVVTGIPTNNPISARVRLFPNPSPGLIFLEINNPQILPLKLTFYDLLGKQILIKEVIEPESKIDISRLTSSSLIFYQLTGSNGFSDSGKILVHLQY